MASESSNIFVRFIDKLFELSSRREPVRVPRKKYLIISLLLGWCGGHRFYTKQYFLGVVYAALFWTGLPMAMTIIDLMIAIPKPQDEEGFILI